jgi:hypothetical protein
LVLAPGQIRLSQVKYLAVKQAMVLLFLEDRVGKYQVTNQAQPAE